MSLSSNISIKANFKEKGFIQIVNKLVDFGWTFNDYGKVTLLPLGDKDDFNCASINKIEQNALFSIFKEKIQATEFVGIVITWGDTNIGGTMLYDSENNTMDLSLTVNRQLINTNSRYTDFSWYLEKIVLPLENEDLNIESITCTDA